MLLDTEEMNMKTQDTPEGNHKYLKCYLSHDQSYYGDSEIPCQSNGPWPSFYFKTSDTRNTIAMIKQLEVYS